MALLPRVRAAPASTRGTTAMVAEFFGDLDVRAMLPRLRELADEWRPDLIVRESWEYGSTIVAEERGIPLARVGLGVAGVEDGQRARGRSRPSTRRGSRPACPPTRTASGCGRRPTSARCRRRSRTRPCRCRRGRCASARPRCPPPAVPDAEPLVYVSFGSVTASAHLPLYPALYRAAIDALAPLPVRLLVTVGEDRDLGELGPLPANVTVERWVPQDEVLAHAQRGRHPRRPRLDARRARPRRAARGRAAVRARPVVQRRGGRARRRRRRARRRAAARASRSSRRSEETLAGAAAGGRAPARRSRARARRREAIADEMRALPPVDEAVAALEAIARDAASA